MIKKLALLFLLLFSYNNVSALQLCSPSEEYLDYMKLKEEERINYQEPIYCSSVFDKKISSSSSVIGSLNKAILGDSSNVSSSFYNAFDDGIVNRSENQFRTGLCWNFSALSVVETNAMKNKAGFYNFSEAHSAYTLISGLYSDTNGQKNKYKYGIDGGKVTFAPTYFFNNGGQVLEDDMPFFPRLVSGTLDTLKTINSSQYISGNNYITVETFKLDNIDNSGSCTLDEINKIKSNILKYGSVQASMYMDEDLFLDSGYDYYISSDSYAIGENHGVVIVGWDDSVPKELFTGATRDGAFIVKNSWGANWSRDGLFYISYDDSFICKVITSFSGVSSKSFDNTYKASDLVGNLIFNLDGTFYTTSKFTKKTLDVETIDRVSFATAMDTKYTVYLSKNNNLNSNNDWILLGTGESDTFGIDSINLDGIEIDNDFTIIVKYEFPGNESSSLFMMCDNSDDVNNVEISTGINHYSSDGRNWFDFSSVPTVSGTVGCEPNIYVYTNNKNSTARLEINAITNIDDNINLTITKKNIPNSNVTYQILDDNGVDVTSHFTITPHFDNSSVNIVSDNTVSGDFSILISGNEVNSSSSFSLIEDIKSNSNNLVIDNDKVVVTIGKGKTLTYKDVYDSLKLKNTGIKITDSKGKTVTSDTAPVGTSSLIETNNERFQVVVVGDLNKDAKLTLGDVAYLFQYVTDQVLLTENTQVLASRIRGKDTITLADVAKLFQYIIGDINSL